MPFTGEIKIILVDPLYGGNLGSVARAMTNFGLGELTLVRPAKGIFEDKMLTAMARESGKNVLGNVVVVDSLTEALVDVEVAIGFSTRLGKKRCDSLDMRPAIEKIVTETPGARVAAVFGSEDQGLSNEDLEKCNWLVRIPTHPALSSLNLSQAVCLFAWEIFSARGEGEDHLSNERSIATVDEMEGFYGHLGTVLRTVGFVEKDNPERMMNAMRRIFSRRLPNPRDVRILRGFLSKIEITVDRAKKGLPLR